MAVVSRPASGSVTAKQALSLPAISGGSMRRFCSSVPNTTTGWRPEIFMGTPSAPLMAAPDSGTAAIMITAWVMPSPAPPYSSGIAMPSQPAAASAACSSCGNSPLRSFSSQYASSNWTQSLRTSSRICCCSGLNEKSIVQPRRFRRRQCSGSGRKELPFDHAVGWAKSLVGKGELAPPACDFAHAENAWALRWRHPGGRMEPRARNAHPTRLHQAGRDHRLDRGRDGQQAAIGIVLADQHEADRRIAGVATRDRDRAPVKKVCDAWIAQDQKVG